MQRFFLFTAHLIIILHSSVQGQQPTLSADQAMIRELEIKWMTAVMKKDRAVLNELLGANFELAKIGGSAATNIKRDKWIENYMKMDWSKFRFDAMQITIDSNLATVNTVLSFKLSPYPFRLSSGVLDIWRKTDGVWKVEKRYLGQDNLSRWLLITEGIAIGILLLWLIRWIRGWFAPGQKKEESIEDKTS